MNVDDVNDGSSQALIARLQNTINTELAPFVDQHKFALLDFPDHANVGDSAIWLGEMAYFDQTGRSPSYVCVQNEVDWNAVDALGPEATIYIHGGGNFGDLWPAHQDFRIEVLQRYPGRRVIQLPQSIHFQNAAGSETTRAVIRDHGNFTLLVRDHPSFEMASQRFACAVRLCPDMAFCIGPKNRRGKPKFNNLNLLRTDLESTNQVGESAAVGDSTSDWLEEPPKLRQHLKRRLALKFFLTHLTLNRTKLEPAVLQAIAGHRFERGLRLLSSGRHVTTDRLHAHILCTLLNVPHTVQDNSYGKISRFMHAWETQWSGVSKKFGDP